MSELPAALISMGLLFLAGLAADQLGARSRLPRVTLLLGCGLLAGQAGFKVIPPVVTDLYPMVSIIALSMVAFLLGGSLSMKALREHGNAILIISVGIVVATIAIVTLGLWALGLPLQSALVLGAIASATDPAATFDVIRQTAVRNGFTETLKGIVAIDDAWGLIAFSLAIVFVASQDGSSAAVLSSTLSEVAGSVGLGLAIGLPAAYLTGRLSDGEPLRIEALGITFLTAGLALALDLSYLLAGMTAGSVVVNFARHHTRAFHEIENLQWPFMVIFFLLAGATLEPSALLVVGPAGLAYVILRSLARLLGGWVGATLAGVPRAEGPWYGPALLPQAGVAIGMALIASEYLPMQADDIMALTIGTTVVFELAGPLAAAFAIRQVTKRTDPGQL